MSLSAETRERNLIDGLCSFSTAQDGRQENQPGANPEVVGEMWGPISQVWKLIVNVKHRASCESLSLLSWTATSADCRTRRGGWWRSRRSFNGRSPTERRCSSRRFNSILCSLRMRQLMRLRDPTLVQARATRSQSLMTFGN